MDVCDASHVLVRSHPFQQGAYPGMRMLDSNPLGPNVRNFAYPALAVLTRMMCFAEG